MKTTKKLTLLIGIALLAVAINSCKKILLIKENPFETQLIYNENNFVLNEKNKIEIDILPDHIVTTTKYEFSYKILKGKGHFETGEGKVINPDEKYVLPSLIEKLYFVTEEIGELSIQMNYKGSDNQTYQDIITVNAGYFSSDFSFEASAVSNSALVDEGTAINFTLDGPTSNQTDKATVKYYLSFTSSANGTVNYKGTEYQQGQKFEITPGTFSAVYTGHDEAQHQIIFKAENDNNTSVEHTAEVSIDYAYYQSDFTFDVTAEETDLFVGDTTHLEFNLSEILKDPVNYIMTYTTSGSGILNYKGTEYNPGDNITILPGVTNAIYVGDIDGAHDLNFSVSNDNVHPQTHSDQVSVNYTYYSSDFNVVAMPEVTTANVGDSVTIDFILTEMLKVPDVNYTMTFASNGAGTFTIGGITYYATQTIPIQPGSFSGKYVGTDAQTHNITFTVSNDNYYPVSHFYDVSIIFQDNEFQINLNQQSGETYPLERTENFYLTVEGGGNTETTLWLEELQTDYPADLEVNDERVDFVKKNVKGVTYPVVIDGNGGQNKINFKTYNTGTNRYRLYVTKNGIEHTAEITLNSAAPPFTISDYHIGWANRYWDLTQYHSASIHTDYSQNIDYTFHFNDHQYSGDKVVNGNTDVSGGRYLDIPDVAGEQTVTVTVTNEFGYSQTTTTSYNALDPRPTAVITSVVIYSYVHQYTHLKENHLSCHIEGFPAEGQYCDEYKVEFWEPCENIWKSGGELVVQGLNGNLSTNEADINAVVILNNDCTSDIVKYRIAVNDDNGRWSQWYIYEK